jgi:ABC-type Fe3+/spermidine/putrescine transport system ATPase subunit
VALADDEVRSSTVDTNAIEGTVLDASYIGVSTQYIIEMKDGQRITVYAQNLETSGASEVLGNGQRVGLSWKPQHTFVIGPAAGPPFPREDMEEPRTDA